MAKEKIKTRQFEIPSAFIGTFFTELEKAELNYGLVEVDQENDELVVDVDYSPDQRD